MNPEDAKHASVELTGLHERFNEALEGHVLICGGCMHIRIESDWYSYPLHRVREICWLDGFPRGAVAL